jgi:uncharacterized protein
MQTDWLLIDGNNLIHREAAERGAPIGDFKAARWRLARRLDELAGRLAARVTLVFDGTRGGRDDAFETASLEVLYCPAHVTADTVIEQLARTSRHPERVLVVTSDRAERDTVEAAGAGTESCGHFLDRLADARRELDLTLGARHARGRGASLGDFFPS